MARCARCGAENPADDRFCGDCGAQLRNACPSCGQGVEPGRRYCGRCGAAVSTAEGAQAETTAPPSSHQQAQPDQPLSERRVCSVLFADLVGFTPLSASRDPEDVRGILSCYFDVARTVIHRYGGVVEKFIGDAVMAVWGTPVAKEGDTERAVRAALDLVTAVQELGSEVAAAGLMARAGVVTGEVAVNIGASGEGMVAGDAVNTASRVQSVAEAGFVLVDEATKRLSQSAISFEDAGAHELKGKESPEHLFRAVRVLSGMGGNQRSDSLEAPFIGRELELRTLKDLFHACVERRSPRLVVVSGPAGVGKSRLGWELEKYLDGLADTVLWHRGRCLSYGEGVAFWALAEIVRQRFGIAEEDPTEVASSKLYEGMVRFVGDEQEREYAGIRLARLLGVPYAAETRAALAREELFAGWRLFFERLAQVAPVVMLVEDAQYADEGLLEFFEHLVDWSRDVPVFVLLFARPGLERIDSGFGVGRNRSTLSLDPLDDSSVDSLVDSLVPGMPLEARHAITSHAEGIPLFAVETIRSLIDRGVVVPEDGAYRLTGGLGDLVVPDSLHALLAARLDALTPEVRSLVADASVLGTSFSKEALVAISNRPEEEVQRGLTELLRRDVLEIFADPLSPQRGSYHFGQEMLRQVAYQTLSKRDRKTRHLAVASHLRRLFANDGEEIADVIARHYLDALSAAPEDADAEENTAEARSFLVRAGERAERSGALDRAQASYAEAADIAVSAQAASLYERASAANQSYGDFEGAVSQADSARARYLEVGDRRGAARVQSLKGLALQRSGRFDAARAEQRAALEVLRPDPDRDTIESLRRLAGLEAFSGNLEEAEQVLNEALILGQELDVDAGLLATLFITRGTAYNRANRPAEAVGAYREGIRLAERAGELGTAGLGLLNLSDVVASTDPVAAADAARIAAEHSRRTGQRYMLGIAVSNLVVALMEIGNWDEAQTIIDESLQGELAGSELLRSVSGWLAGLRGDAERAADMLESLSMKRESEDPQDQSEVALTEACVSLSQGDAPLALSHALRALESAQVFGIRNETGRWAWPVAARAARSTGASGTLEQLLAMLDAHPIGHLPPILRAERLLLRAWTTASSGEGSSDDATASFETAVAALRDARNPYQLAHGLVDQAAHLLGAGREAEGEAALAEANEIADRLRCPALRERAEKVGTDLLRAR